MHQKRDAWMNESRVCEYIRGLLEVDMGNKIWATKAPKGNRHAGDEMDTDIEDRLYKAIDYLLRGKPSAYMDDDIIAAIHAATEDPRYNDVFRYYTSGKVYRGMRLSGPWDVEEDYGVPNQIWKKQLHDQTNPKKVRGMLKNMSELMSVSADYEPLIRDSGLSSWTVDFKVARGFAENVRDPRSNTEMGIILVTDASTGRFLDMTPMYEYEGLDTHAKEMERVAIGPVPLEGIYLIQPEKKSWWI